MPKRPYNFLEVGRTGLIQSAGYIYSEFLSQLRGLTGIKTYREMRDNDSIIGACIHAITQIMRESRWDVKPAENGSEEDAVFLEDCMTDMESSWMDFFSEVLSMLTYGWSWFETVYYRRKDNKIGWRKLAPRVQGAYEKWEFDDVGDVLGMWHRPAPQYQLFFLPLSKCLHFRTEPYGANPEGRSILRNAYRPWYFKKHIEEIEAIGVERDLTGLPLLKLPESVNPDSDDPEVVAMITAAKRLITNVRRDEQDGILLPYGWEFELTASPGHRQIDTTSVINRYNKEIAVTVLAQFVMLGMERTGSYALAREQTDMFYQCLEGWMDSITTQFNRTAVRKLFALNGVTNRALPYIVHTPVRRYSLKDVADYVSKLADERVNAIEVEDDLRNFLTQYARLKEYSEIRK